MTNGSSDRIDQIEQLLEQIAQIQPISLQGQQQEQIQVLIERLDAIIERMVYREGRNGNGDQPKQ